MTTVSKRSRLPFDPIDEARRHWRSHGWDDAAEGMGVVTSVIRAEQILSGRAEEAVRPLGLTFARYEVLMLLRFSRRGELPLGKIGERLQVGAGSVTNAIDRLERDHLVRRRMNPDDGRGILAVVTKKGIRLAELATDALNESLFTRLELTETESRALFALLATLRQRAGDFD
jgi:DNA-binding MarR family transcriptional regulator